MQSPDRALAETQLLNAIMSASAGKADLDRILDVALKQLSQVLRFTGGSIALIEGDELVVRAAFGPFTQQALLGRLRHSRGLSWRVIDGCEPLLVNDIEAAGMRSTTPIRAWLGVPLLRSGKAFGLLEIDSTEINMFGEADVNLVQKVAVALSGSIELAEHIAERRQAEEALQRSRDQLEIILQGVADAILVQDASGRFVYANEAAARDAGYASVAALLAASPVDLVGRFACFDEFGRPFDMRDLPGRRALAGDLHPPEVLLNVRRRDDGEQYWRILKAHPVLGPDGHPQMAVNIWIDVTERRRGEDDRTRLAAIVHSSEDAIFSASLDGVIRTWNPGAKRIYGYAAEEIVGRPFVSLVDADRYEEVAHILREVALGRSLTHFETAHLTRDGRQIFVSLSVSPLRAVHGDLHGLSVVARDISERRRRDDTQRFLAEASALLGSSLDYEGTLALVAKLAVPHISDWCAVDLVRDGTLQQVAMAHVDPAQLELARELLARYPADPNSAMSAHVVVSSGQPILVPDLPDELLAAGANDAEHLRLLRAIAPRSLMIVPMIANGRTLGALTFCSTQQARRFDRGDLQLAQSLASRAAFAIENARLYRDLQQLNEQLEQRVVQRTAELQSLNRNLQAEIAERRQAEADLRRAHEQIAQSEERFTLLVHGVVDYAIILLDPYGNVASWNTGAERLNQYRAEEIIGQHFSRFYTAEDIAAGRPYRMLEEAAEVGRVQSEGWRVRKDGTRFWADVVVTALHDDAGELRGFAKVTRDMTERRNVDEQMRQTNMQLRRLSGHVQSAREEERTRVAREIHDELGQVLTAVKMDLTLIGKKLRDERQPMSRTQIADDLRSMSKLIDETIRAVREIITELRPEMLEDLGLKAAMEWQAQEYQSRTGIRCHLNADLEYLDLDIERATAVFRIFQEALTNVAKHANATEVHVDLHQEPERLVLEVQDNGRGITPDELRKVKSFGILGMRERAILFGGTVDVSSRTTQGTVVRVYVPLAASEDA